MKELRMQKLRMKTLLIMGLAVLLALAAYVAAGPYLTVRAIRAAVQAQDSGALAKQVDFPALRASLKAQLTDVVVREAGPDVQSNVFGAFALTMATGVVNATVDAMVNPVGLAALMQGRRMWLDARDSFMRPTIDADGSPVPPEDPLRGARYRYESLSRFTATIDDEAGRPVVFVLRRDGLQWRLADIRLPLEKRQAPENRSTVPGSEN